MPRDKGRDSDPENFSLYIGCSAVGRAVTSDNRNPRFKSRHQQLYLLSTVLNKLLSKDENKEKRVRDSLFF